MVLVSSVVQNENAVCSLLTKDDDDPCRSRCETSEEEEISMDKSSSKIRV